ncbi:MAG: hypothetical protein GY895_14165 [Phycisphaera sp.]|nr:hypothetical protein [Phycisphaera sp.]
MIRSSTNALGILAAITISTPVPAAGDGLSIEDVYGIYQRATPVTNDHTGVLQPWESRVVWTDAAGANWNLQPDLENHRLLVGPDCPYYVEDGDIGFELTVEDGPDGPNVVSFEFRNRDHHLVSTGSTLQFVLDGRVPTISDHYVAAARTWFEARDQYDVGAYDDALETLDGLWNEYPVGDSVWWSIFGDDPMGLNLGTPPCYYGLRQLTDMTEWRVANPDHPGTDRTIRLSVLAVGRSRGLEPRTMAELVAGEGIEVVHDFDGRVAANDYEAVRDSLEFFCEYIHAITRGMLEVEVEIIPLPDLEVGVVAEAGSPDGPYFATIQNYWEPLGALTQAQIDATDWWWVTYPSHVPDHHDEFQYLAFIAGGMGGAPNGSPVFISDERWLARKPGHLGVGTYVPEERQTYLPQWLQHEIFHHFYRVWSGFGLEDQSHQWFDRSTWPTDFVGRFEPDYYHESVFKRLQEATGPTLVAGLRNAVDDVSFEDLGIEDVLGDYERLPVQNPWHQGEVRLSDSQMSWRNAAGVSWSLVPNIPEGRLEIGPDCPYYDPDAPGANDFRLARGEDEFGDPTGTYAGFVFNGELHSLNRPCDADFNDDGVVDGADLAVLLIQWGPFDAMADLDGDGAVGGSDLGLLFTGWGPCPGTGSGFQPRRSNDRIGADERRPFTAGMLHGPPAPPSRLGTEVGCTCRHGRHDDSVGCRRHPMGTSPARR